MTIRAAFALTLSTSVAALIVLLGAPAQASAYGCTGSGVYDCVDIKGTGTYVTSVTGKFGVGPRGAASGHYRIQMPGGTVYNSPTFKYHNESYFHSQSWTWPKTIKRYVPSGKLCAQFITSKYATRPACKTVHR